jgi:hypothetical protein
MPPKMKLSVDVMERQEEARLRFEKLLEKDPEKYKKDKVEHDFSAKALDMEHVRALTDLIGYCVFLSFVMCVVFLNPAEYHANKIIKGATGALTNSSTVTNYAEMWDFIRALTPIAHATEYYSGEVFMNTSAGEYQPYWMGDTSNNLALGRIRLRQLRVNGQTCRIPSAFEGKILRCNANAATSNLVRSGTYEEKGGFQCEYELHGDGYAWYSGTTKIQYPSEGFVVTLPLTAGAASSYIDKLHQYNWVDDRTRAVFVEFSLYNANVDHFAVKPQDGRK